MREAYEKDKTVWKFHFEHSLVSELVRRQWSILSVIRIKMAFERLGGELASISLMMSNMDSVNTFCGFPRSFECDVAKRQGRRIEDIVY